MREDLLYYLFLKANLNKQLYSLLQMVDGVVTVATEVTSMKAGVVIGDVITLVNFLGQLTFSG